MHSDHLDSTSVISGAQSGDIKYFPYGATRSGSVGTAYKFTGQRLDDSTGLYYYGARYYDPAIGRFIQADSIVPNPGNPQALNRYSYVRNNPLRYTDPTGHMVADDSADGPTPPPPDDRDLTDWLVRKMAANARNSGIKAIRGMNRAASALWSINAKGTAVMVHAPAAWAWKGAVEDSARWDFKDKIRKELGESIMLCHIGGCEWFEYSVPGNVHYAYVGGAAGFSFAELHAGASVAEIIDPDHAHERNLPGLYVNPDWASTGFDNPEDYWAIEFGYALYENYGPNVTIHEFKALLVEYAPKLAHWPAPSQPYYSPYGTNYPLHHFDGGQ